MMASLDQSLLRMGLDYVDIFYHHRPDPDTPLEESMEALALAVLQGKALYVGVSQYPAELVRKASEILANWNIRLLIHQPRYSMMDRWVEKDLLNCLEEKGIGAIAFSPLEQGVLSNKYLNGFPEDSRAVRDGRYLSTDKLNDSLIEKVRALNNVATKRGQSLAQMAVAWLLKDSRVTSVLVGASRVEQLEQNVAALSNIVFEIDELAAIEKILAS